ncbi:hypothetical protein, partial [Salmonella enterica]
NARRKGVGRVRGEEDTALYQRKYRQYQDLIEALQGYHARIKEHAL